MITADHLAAELRRSGVRHVRGCGAETPGTGRDGLPADTLLLPHPDRHLAGRLAGLLADLLS